MGDVGGDVHKVPSPGNEMVLELLAIPHACFAAEDVNRGFVTDVLMGFAPSAGRDSRDLQVYPTCADRLSGDARRVHVSVLADELLSRGKDSAGGLRTTLGHDRRCVGHLLRLPV